MEIKLTHNETLEYMHYVKELDTLAASIRSDLSIPRGMVLEEAMFDIFVNGKHPFDGKRIFFN